MKESVELSGLKPKPLKVKDASPKVYVTAQFRLAGSDRYESAKMNGATEAILRAVGEALLAVADGKDASGLNVVLRDDTTEAEVNEDGRITKGGGRFGTGHAGLKVGGTVRFGK